jgi:hypothetical protein
MDVSVRIEIDVNAGYSAIAKSENVAETAARSFATGPRLTGHFPLGSAFDNQIVA